MSGQLVYFVALTAMHVETEEVGGDTNTGLTAPVIDELDIPQSRRNELLRESRNSVVNRLSEVISDALNKMSLELNEAASSAKEPTEQRALLDAVNLITQHSAEIEGQFRQSFADLFQKRLMGTSALPVDSDTDEVELSLVDESLMRDRLKVQQLIERARGKLDPEQVLGMRARLAALVGREWFDEDEQPAAPEAVFEALKASVDQIDGETEVKTALLEAFAPHVASQLNTVYLSVNEHLRASQVLPKIKPRVAINPDTGKPYKEGEQPADQAVEKAMGEEGESFLLPKDKEKREAILDVLAKEVAAGGQEARSSAVQMLTEPKNFGVADLPMPEPEANLISALDNIQTLETDESHAQPEGLRDLSEQTREMGSPLDKLTVEIVSLIFGFLEQDPRIPAIIKQQLLRLQVVAVKAALLDRSFFASRQHPMRRMIDRTTDISCDPETDTAEDSHFTRGLIELIDWVLAEFDRDLRVFENGVDKLALLEAAENERRAMKLADLARDTELDEIETLARDQASAELKARADMLTPEFVQSFLDEWWLEVMVAARLEDHRLGSEGLWSERLEIAEKLIWSIGPKAGGEVRKMAVMLPKMIMGIVEGLKSIDAQDGQHTRFFDELMKWHTRIIDEAKQAERSAHRADAPITMKEDGSVHFIGGLERPAEQAPAPTVRSSGVSLDSLKRGQRFELRIEGIAPFAVKLAFISPARKLFALSRFPDFAQSFDREEFAQMLDDGELVRIEDKASIDRAIESVGGKPLPPDRSNEERDGSDALDANTLTFADEIAADEQIPV